MADRLRPGRRGLAIVAACVLAATLGTLAHAQDQWYRFYEDGEVAFKRGDYVTAEQRFLAAINHKQAPSTRGYDVRRVSQVYGFIPEFYLAVAYTRLKRYDDAALYIQKAEQYIKRGDPNFAVLETAKNETTRALTTGAAQLQIDGLVRDAKDAMSGGRSEAARKLLTEALALSGDLSGAKALLDRLNRDEFDSLMRDAKLAFDTGRHAEAVRLATAARRLNVDNRQADDLLARAADHQQFDQKMAEAREALTAGRVNDALSALGAARRLNIDNAAVDKLQGEATRQTDLSRSVADATAAIGSRRWADARHALSRAASAGLDNRRSSELLRNVEIGEAVDAIDAALTRKDYVAASTAVDQLRRLDPTHAVISRAQGLIGGNLSLVQKERVGLAQFFRGQYSAAIATLSGLSAESSPRARFYIACSRAALSLLAHDPAAGKQLLDEARQDVAFLKNREALFEAHARLMSPKILDLLGLSGG